MEGPAERAASKGMVRQRTFTKEEQRNCNGDKEARQEESNTGQEGSWPAERRQRKQWRRPEGNSTDTAYFVFAMGQGLLY